MSDMYLELMSRIPVVAARTHVGSARLQEAQDAVGLSNESVARLIPVSEKTWWQGVNVFCHGYGAGYWTCESNGKRFAAVAFSPTRVAVTLLT